MTGKIPTVLAAALIDGQRHAQVAQTQYLVLHEAIALLIGHLHRAGQTDAENLAAELLRSMSAAEIQQGWPLAPELAQILADRIRDAAAPPVAP